MVGGAAQDAGGRSRRNIDHEYDSRTDGILEAALMVVQWKRSRVLRVGCLCFGKASPRLWNRLDFWLAR